MKKYLLLILCPLATVAFCMACTSDFEEDDDDSSSEEVTESTEDDLVENSVFDATVSVSFSGTSATVTNSVAGVSVSQSGADVVITSTVEGVEYLLSGTTTSGSFKIYSDYKFKLTLNGVDITSSSGPAINVQSHKRVFAVLADGTTNKLTDSASYASSTEDQKACLFSEGQLIFSGSGSLTVTGKYKHGICSDDYVLVRSGATVTVAAAATDGIHTNEAVLIDGGTVTITSTDEGINCEEGVVTINSGAVTITTTAASAKGIKGYGNVTINGGDIVVTTKGGDGSEGIESKSILTINDGNIAVTSYDDCINAAASLVINGGTIYCYSSNNDGIDSNGTLTITGGLIISSGTTSPEEGFDCDQNTFKITGGTILGVGGSSSTPTSSVSTQRSVIYGGSGTSGKYISIVSSDGENLFSYKLPRSYSQMTLLYSSSSLLSGGSYTIYSGGTVSGGTDFNGYLSGATYTAGTQLGTFTATSIVTQVGSTSSSGR
jgi:hypothetical protein